MDGAAKILRGTAAHPGRRIEAAVWDADRRVREMNAAAEDDARRIRAEAEAERSRLRAEAISAGRAEGVAAAAAELVRAATARDRLLARVRADLVELAVAIARRILAREVAAGDAVEAIAAAALAEARERREVVLRIHPADAARIRGARERLDALLLRGALAVREDPAVPPGGAVVETEAGSLDARIETQLELLAAALRAEVAP